LSAITGLGLWIFIALLIPTIGAQYLPAVGLSLFAMPVFLTLLSLRSLSGQSTKGWRAFLLFLGLLLISIQLVSSRSIPLHLISGVAVFLVAAYRLRIWIYLK